MKTLWERISDTIIVGIILFSLAAVALLILVAELLGLESNLTKPFIGGAMIELKVADLKKDSFRHQVFNNAAIGFVELWPGEEMAEHNTKENIEMIIPFTGEIKVFTRRSLQDNYKEQTYRARDSVVFLGPGTFHKVINNSRDLAEYSFIVVRVDINLL